MVFRAESSTMENRLSGYYDNIRRRRIQLIQDSAYLSTNRDARYIAGRGSVIYARIVSRTGGTVGPSPPVSDGAYRVGENTAFCAAFFSPPVCNGRLFCFCARRPIQRARTTHPRTGRERTAAEARRVRTDDGKFRTSGRSGSPFICYRSRAKTPAFPPSPTPSRKFALSPGNSPPGEYNVDSPAHRMKRWSHCSGTHRCTRQTSSLN